MLVIILLQIILNCRVNGQSQSVVYELRTSSCPSTNRIYTQSQCQTAAGIISSSDDSLTINTEADVSSSSSEPKCWVSVSVSESTGSTGTLNYNQVTSSSAQCDNNRWDVEFPNKQAVDGAEDCATYRSDGQYDRYGNPRVCSVQKRNNHVG